MSVQPRSEEATDVLATSAAGPAAVRGGALRTASYLIGVLASAGAAALLFRHLGVRDTGRYVTILSLVALVAGVSDLGLNAIGIRESAVRSQAQRSELLADLLGLRLTMTTLGLAIMVLVAAFAYTRVILLGVALAGTGLLLQTTQDNLIVPLTTALKLGRVAALELLRSMLSIVAIAVLVAAGAHLLSFTAVPIAVGLCVLPAAARLVRTRRSLLPAFSWSRWRPLLASVLPYSVAVAAATFYFRVAIIVVSQLGTARQLGLFGASFRIVEVLVVLPGLLAGAAFPIFARSAHEDHDRLGYALGRVFEVALVAGAGIAVAFAVGAPLAIEIIGGRRFSAASGVLAIQGVGLGATFVSTVWGTGLLSLRMHREILALNVAALVGSVALLCVLVPLDGATGAAIGTAVGEVGAAVASAAILVHRHPVLRPSMRVVPRVALAAALGLAPLALDTGVIVRLALGLVLFTATVLWTGALPRELRALVPRRGFGSATVR